MGKSALLEYLMQHAPGCAIVRAAGVESEMELAYAGLQQLCAPFGDRLDHLPGPQHDALGTAFGLRDGDAPDRFLVGLAVLSLLSDAAAERPLVCVVDDAQWLDAASANALAFVARRLGAESVGLVLAVREAPGERPFDGLPELVVGGLEDDDARALLEAVVAGPLDERVRERIVAETHGNPLALLELPQGRTPAELAGGFGLDGEPALAGRIEARYQERLETLPEATRLLLLVAAAEPLGDPLLLWSAASALGIDPGAGAPAVAAGLIELGGQVRFHHPLVRSAVYGAAAPEDRRRVHESLADATDAQAAPDRRAWHWAQATTGLDEEVAAELERSAARAGARGGLAAGAAFHERAAELTPDPARRARRALAAAHCKHQAGAPDAALRLLAMAQAGAAGRARPRAGAAAPRPNRVLHDARPRRSTAAARGRQAAGAAGRDARARDVPRRVRRGALGRPAGGRRRRARDRRRRPRRRLGAVGAGVRPAARRPRAPHRGRLRRGRTGAEGRAALVPGGGADRGGGAALAVARVPHRPGTRRRRGVGRAHGASGGARAPHRSACAPAGRPGRPDPCRPLLRPARPRGGAGRRGRSRGRGDRQPCGAARRDHPGELGGQGRGGAGAGRGTPAGSRAARRGPLAHGHGVGQRRPLQRARALRRGAGRGRAGRGGLARARHADVAAGRP